MAKKKQPFMVFETKEEFDKAFDKAMLAGRKQGFKDGCVWVFSYFYELAQDMFEPQLFMDAEQEIRRRHIEKWRKDHTSESLKNWLDKKHMFDES